MAFVSDLKINANYEIYRINDLKRFSIKTSQTAD